MTGSTIYDIVLLILCVIVLGVVALAGGALVYMARRNRWRKRW